MSKENTRARRLELIFAAHPKVKQFHVTADDQAFFEEGDAKNHARTLEDRTIEVVIRSGKKSEAAKKSDLSTDQPTAAKSGASEDGTGKGPAKADTPKKGSAPKKADAPKKGAAAKKADPEPPAAPDGNEGEAGSND